MPLNRRDRSRSPMNIHNVGYRRETTNKDGQPDISTMPMNQMMMPNMFAQGKGNMMMAGGVFSNMMMPNMMGAGMIQNTGMEVMGGSPMELAPQATMDMSSMAGSSVTPPTGNPMDMGMMGGMMMDPSMMGLYPAMGADITPMQERKELVFKYCKLLPPEAAKPQPMRRARPPGCRTIFVGGLPEKVRENIVRDIFETYGRIITLRLSKKNFCHIRFDRESSVEAAMIVSGCKLVLTGNKDNDSEENEQETRLNSGWIHVDYAWSRDDQNEYERRQRQALRAQQSEIEELSAQKDSRRRIPEIPYRSPSPPPVMIFSSSTVSDVAENIKSEDNFAAAVPTLLAWLERGECSKKTASQFYSMIQSTNAHIRRLFNEKMQAEDELMECKERVKKRIESVIELLEQVAKVFVAATHQRVWDHFTKPQRKNIETWQKMTQEFKALKEEFNEKFNDDEFIDNYEKKSEVTVEELQQLKRENESLQFQLEAYRNEIDVIKADAQKEMEKFKAQFIARQALQNNFEKNPPLPEPAMRPAPPPPLPEEGDQKAQMKEAVEAGCGEAKLIGVMAAFLQVHPKGASLDYVASYVRALFPHITQGSIHHVLQKHKDVFKRTTTGVGMNIEHKWSFIAFNPEEVANEDNV